MQQELDQRAHLSFVAGFLIDVLVFLWAIQRGYDALYVFCIIAACMCVHFAYQYWQFATYGRPGYYEQTMQNATGNEAQEPQEETAQPAERELHIARIVPESRIFSDLSEERIFFFTQLANFLTGVLAGNTGRNYWTSNGWPTQTYQDLIGLFEECGIVASAGQGAARILLTRDETHAWLLLNKRFKLNIPASLDASRVIKSRGKIVQSPTLPIDSD